jgi:hypothetical protein
LGACADDLLIDPLGVDNGLPKQSETAGNTPDQEGALAGEPDRDENIPVQEGPLPEEPLIGGDLPVQNLPAPVTNAEPFDWAVFAAERAEWAQMAWGQTGYIFKQTHSLSEPAYSLRRINIVYLDVLYSKLEGGQTDWDPLFLGTTVSEVYDIVYGLGIGDAAALAARGLSSLLIKYDSQYHYPAYIQTVDTNGVVYTAEFEALKVTVNLPDAGDTSTGIGEGQNGEEFSIFISGTY